MDRERIDSFDFMRSVTAWIIIIYHFAWICNSTPQYGYFPFFYTHANGIWGENTSVNIFFMLSGASLYYNYPAVKPHSLRRFYFGRFKRIFPMFYMLWFFLYYQRAAAYGHPFYNGSPKTMLLTLFGMDGYLNDHFPQTYYIIGEWFLGALVCLQILYPLMAWCMKRCKIPVTLSLCAGTLFLHWNPAFFNFQRERNLIVCLFAFWLGMLFIERREILSSVWVTAAFGSVALFLIFVKTPFDPFLCAQFISIGLFLLLYHAGRLIMKIKILNQFFSYTSRISYPIFLLQHVTMGQILGMFGRYFPKLWLELILLLATFFFIYLFSDIAARLNNILLNSKWFLRVQDFVCSGRQ